MSLLRLSTCVWLLLLLTLSVVPARDRPVLLPWHGAEHALAFGLAGALVSLATRGSAWRGLLAVLGFAILVELAQWPLTTRHARWSDLLVDSLAISAGYGLIVALRAWQARRVQR